MLKSGIFHVPHVVPVVQDQLYSVMIRTIYFDFKEIRKFGFDWMEIRYNEP